MTEAEALRSILFVPGIRGELIAKAGNAGADALILDLEDSVAAGAKDEARALVMAALAGSADHLTFIRINHPSLGDLEKDLSVLAAHPSQVIMVPKVEHRDDLTDLERHLTEFEHAAGLAQGAIGVMVAVESAKGLRNLFDVLSTTPRVRGAALASAEEGDLMADIHGQWTPTGEALAYARGKFVCDARDAKMAWVFDGAFMQLQDDTALETECRLARVYGFSGKAAIHPRQIATINEVFSPSEKEIDYARRLLQAFREAEATGRGAVKFEGMMVDYANVKRAESVLALASAIAKTTQTNPSGGGA